MNKNEAISRVRSMFAESIGADIVSGPEIDQDMQDFDDLIQIIAR